MIISSGSYYVIEGFAPAMHTDMGGFGFNTGIEKNLAKKAFEEEISDEMHNRFQIIGEKLVKRIRLTGEDHTVFPSYAFVRNEQEKLTSLLHYVTVPGNACDLGTDWGEIGDLNRENSFGKFLGYYPYNVDSTTQAYGLLSLWLHWADFAHYKFGEKDEE